MANAYWLDDYATLDLQTQGGTSIPIAGIQDVTIVPSVSIEHLYTADSIKKEVSKQHEFIVDVEIGFSLWDESLVAQWLDGSSTTAATSMADQSDPQEYKIDSADFDSSDGSTQINATVEDITFEEMPIIDASRGEFVQWGLTGEGGDLTNFSTTTP